MSDIKIIPVYGSKDTISKQIKKNNLSEGLQVVPPLQFVLEGGIRFSIQDESTDSFNSDICFIKLSKPIDNEEENTLLKALKIKKAPINIFPNQEEDNDITQYIKELNDEEKELFSTLEEDIADEYMTNLGEISVKDFMRLQDTWNRLDDDKSRSIVIQTERHIIPKMMPEWSSQSYLIYNPIIEKDNKLIYGINPEDQFIFPIYKFNFLPEEGGLVIKNDGKLLFIADAATGYTIESKTPGLVTLITSDDDTEFQVAQSWMIHHDQLDGCNPQITREVVESLSEILAESYEDTEIKYYFPKNIQGNPEDILGSIFNEQTTQNIERSLVGYIDYDEEDDEDDY